MKALYHPLAVCLFSSRKPLDVLQSPLPSAGHLWSNPLVLCRAATPAGITLLPLCHVAAPTQSCNRVRQPTPVPQLLRHPLRSELPGVVSTCNAAAASQPYHPSRICQPAHRIQNPLQSTLKFSNAFLQCCSECNPSMVPPLSMPINLAQCLMSD